MSAGVEARFAGRMGVTGDGGGPPGRPGPLLGHPQPVEPGLGEEDVGGQAGVVAVEERAGYAVAVEDVLDVRHHLQPSGLIGLQERSMLLGGRTIIESCPGSGTTITAELPLDKITPA